MSNLPEERRRGRRFDTEMEVYFKLSYDVKTKVEFTKINESENEESKKYIAISKNVSSVGICFTSDVKLEAGDELFMEVFTPGSEKPITMKGEARWSKEVPFNERYGEMNHEGDKRYDTGVKVITVDGKNVKDTIYYDEKYKIEWSIILDSVLGSYSKQSKERK